MLSHFAVMGGECNYLLLPRCEDEDGRIRVVLSYVPEEKWKDGRGVRWEHGDVQALLDGAQVRCLAGAGADGVGAVLTPVAAPSAGVSAGDGAQAGPQDAGGAQGPSGRCVTRCPLRPPPDSHTHTHTRCHSLSGLIQADPEGHFSYETLEEIALSVQEALKGRVVPHCAFNGGRDVWVDVGNKALGIRALQARAHPAPMPPVAGCDT